MDRAEVNFRFFPGGRWANDWSRGGLELGFVARFGGIQFLPALYLQYYEGYAESLLFYNKKVNHVKIGFIF
jgi:outer membrane phospholipase A